MLVINDAQFAKRAEIIWEKGTNRSAFFRGEVDKYGWVDIGSSFLPSEITAAFLYAQLQNVEAIQNKRKNLWRLYFENLKSLEDDGYLVLPNIPNNATNNAHMFYIVCNSLSERMALIEHLRENNVYAVFHYLSLHHSPYYIEKHDGRSLPNSDSYSDKLIRLPMYVELEEKEVCFITNCIDSFYLNYASEKKDSFCGDGFLAGGSSTFCS